MVPRTHSQSEVRAGWGWHLLMESSPWLGSMLDRLLLGEALELLHFWDTLVVIKAETYLSFLTVLLGKNMQRFIHKIDTVLISCVSCSIFSLLTFEKRQVCF